MLNNKRFRFFLGICWLLLVGTQQSYTHPLSVSYSHFSINGNSIDAEYRVPMDDMDLLLRLDSDLDNIISEPELEDARAEINNYIQDRVELSANVEEPEPEFINYQIWYDSDEFPYLQVDANYRFDVPVTSVNISVRFLTDLYPQHRNLAELRDGQNTSQFVFQNDNSWIWESQSAGIWKTAIEFILFGIQHIVTGYDHLLFLLGLLLVGSGLRNLVAVVTSFTVAHSMTLALATLGLVQPSGRLVEAVIALSIVYVGIENLFVKKVSHRWLLAFIFGLVHGFGFAGLLQDMDLEHTGLLLSLFTFNLGVEIGQVTMVAIAWPFLIQLSKTTYRKPIVQLLSLLIAIFGMIWFVERIM